MAKLNAAGNIIVELGDTLSGIAEQFKTTVENLVKKNDIKEPDFIIVEDQELVLNGDPVSTVNTTSTCIVNVFGRQTGTERTIYASWIWNKDNTKEYKYRWEYATGDGVGFIGSEGTTEHKQSLYTMPDNATHVAFQVKPISKTYTKNNKETSYWTAGWSTVKRFYEDDLPPVAPDVPTVTITDYTLTAELQNIAIDAHKILFHVVQDDEKTYKQGSADIKTTAASWSCEVEAGHEYKVRARGLRGSLTGEYSQYSGNVSTIPAASKGITTLKAYEETSVYIDWSKVKNAETYEVEYTEQKRYFDSGTSNVSSVTVDATVIGHAEITGLETGKEWFFRVRATNSQGSSDWTEIKSIKIGTAPAVPTTWSSTTTAIVGEDITLYWTHNTEDGSTQTTAELELSVGGYVTTHTIDTSSRDEDEVNVYSINTSGYTEGTRIRWRVRTKGIIDSWSDWSTQRTIDVYAPPTLVLSVTNSSEEILSTLESFPFYISAEAGPDTQTPIGYHVSVISTESYETTDSIGNIKIVSAGEEVYSKYFDVNTDLLLEMTPSSLNLENNVTYTVTCTVSMNSGLTAIESTQFTVAWSDMYYEPNAEIGIDYESLTASIRPFCEDEYGQLLEDVTLSVYRREFDGSFTEIGTNINNTSNTFVTDPHPALDYARYRIVAVTNSTGAISYGDIPGIPVGEKAIIIQWDEEWSNFDSENNDPLAQQPWTGSMLKLPYNVDVSDSHSSDVNLVEYIGRKHPVSYYGTQLGETATWNVEIEKSDTETLYALRRLAIWMGDVYVREPSGSGYWANISVSFSQKHCELTIPVTLDIKRVAGGV